MANYADYRLEEMDEDFMLADIEEEPFVDITEQRMIMSSLGWDVGDAYDIVYFGKFSINFCHNY